jgi:hypothetical protein
MIGALAVYLMLEAISGLDKITPTVDQIQQEEYLAVFHVGIRRIIPVEMNLDTNRLEYDYETTYETAADVLAVSDAIAADAGWTLEQRGEDFRTYSKLVRFNQYYRIEQIVRMTFLPGFHRVKIINSPGQWVYSPEPFPRMLRDK